MSGRRLKPTLQAGARATRQGHMNCNPSGMRYCFVILSCCICEGQSISIGVIGGGRTTDDVTYAAVPESRRYIVGPTIELGLPFNFAVEFDALYHRHGYSLANGNFAYYVSETERANSWEFPLLLKYKLPIRGIKPFVEAGLAGRSITGSIHETGASIDIMTGQQTPFNTVVNTNFSASLGFVAGGGVRMGVGRLRVSPEVRYTYWNNMPLSGYFGDGPSYGSTQNQFDVMVGIGWRLR
jgi:hypothetical protein